MTGPRPGWQSRIEDALFAFGMFVDQHAGIPPTTRELSEAMQFSSKSVGERWYSRLENIGYVRHAVPTRGAGSTVDYVFTAAGREAFEREKQLRLAQPAG